MSIDIKSLIRSHLKDLKPYSSARDEYKGDLGVFLDANENSFGSVGVAENYNRYPDPLQMDIKNALGKLRSLNAENIFLGNGSDEPIDLLFRIFCNPAEDNVIILPPTYGMYQVCADINNVEARKVALTESFDINADRILEEVDAKTKLIFICSPNNPTANSISILEVEKVLKSFSGLVVVDEAYIDFSDKPSFLNYLPIYPNLVVLQTFSKAWGLAALRVGMAFANNAIIEIMNKVKYPYNINKYSQEIVLNAINNVAIKDQHVTEILEQREVLAKELEAFECVQNIYPSDANFLLVKVTDANKIYDYLIDKKVIVRNRTNVELCLNCLRITIGTPEENQALLSELRNFKE